MADTLRWMLHHNRWSSILGRFLTPPEKPVTNPPFDLTINPYRRAYNDHHLPLDAPAIRSVVTAQGVAHDEKIKKCKIKE